MDICVMYPNYRRAEYYWHKTLDALHMEFEEDLRNLMLKKISKYPMYISFSFGNLYFILESNYDMWSKGKHNIKYLQYYQYEDLLNKILSEEKRK